MSSYSKSSSGKKSNSKSSTNKPFCKVCYDAGKPEREYTSHYVKSKPGHEGKVVCPYLLSLVCTYCKKKAGHTAKHCPVLIEKNKKEETNEPVRCRLADTPPPPTVPVLKPSQKSSWAAIASAKQKPIINIAVPIIAAPIIAAPIIAVPTPSPTPEAIRMIQEKKEEEECSESEAEEEVTETPPPLTTTNYSYTGSSWADEE
jgi:hypothetical protein